MDNQIDNDIKNRIRDVFEDLEDPSADEGWLLLREKYPEKKRRAIVWLWWGTAAVLFLLLGIQFFNAVKVNKNEHLAFKPIKPGRPNVETVDKNKKSTVSVPTRTDTALTKVTVTSNGKTNNAHLRQNIDHINDRSGLAANKRADAKQAPANKVEENVDQVPEKPADTALLATAADRPADPAISSPVDVRSKMGQTSVVLKPATSVHNDLNSVPKRSVENSNYQKVLFGVYGATFVNFASGGSAKVNAGAGVTTDIRVGKNISLSTGVALAQNSFSYGSSPGFAMADPSNGSNPGTGGGSTGRSSANAANLISLDIPINFKFGLDPSGNTFFSTGLSSGTFITETYTSGTGQQTQIVDSKSFDNFYFARILNFSFGTTLPIGKTNNLIIEPFIKYPLGSLGGQQIKFGTGGVNLKFNLQPVKK